MLPLAIVTIHIFVVDEKVELNVAPALIRFQFLESIEVVICGRINLLIQWRCGELIISVRHIFELKLANLLAVAEIA